MTYTSSNWNRKILEVHVRIRIARRVIAGLSTELPALVDRWQQVDYALTGALSLAAEVSRLREELVDIRRLRANLAAAGSATIAAHHDGEQDPLSYLHDELQAQGYRVDRGRG